MRRTGWPTSIVLRRAAFGIDCGKHDRRDGAASILVELVSIWPRASGVLLTSVAVNGTTAFLVILAVTLG